MNSYQTYGKRLFDFSFSLVFIIAFCWLYTLIILLYFLSGNFPVFYRSLRIGKNGAPFWMIKFRTLSTNEYLPLHQRVFWLGRLLRKTNLDEIPQVWNVLKGEMSWVGPRPLPVTYESAMTDEQKKRHHVLPGITGLAQIKGKNNLSWDKKFEYDLQYVNKMSLSRDIKILFLTLIEIISLRNDVSLNEQSLIREKNT